MRFPRSHGALGGIISSSRTTSRARVTTRRCRSTLTLAIETSCDDTCVAVLEKNGPAARLLFNKQVTSDSRRFGGIHPAVAVLGHTINIAGVIDEAIQALPESNRAPNTTYNTLTCHSTARRFRLPDFVTVTRGPGMPTNLAVGLSAAKGLAAGWQIPLLGVNHMQAHALTPRLVTALRQWDASPHPRTDRHSITPTFPFLSLLVSGGHTQLVLSQSATEHTTIADAENMAVGNFLDSAAKYILPESIKAASPNVSYGPALERFAFPSATEAQQQQQQDGHPRRYGSAPSPGETPGSTQYNYTPPRDRGEENLQYDSELGWKLTPPLSMTKNPVMDKYDFSGLSSQVQRIVEKHPTMGDEERRHLARATMGVTFEHLASRLVHALHRMEKKRISKKIYSPPVDTLVVSGGVASNKFLRHVLRKVMDIRGFASVRIVTPPAELCTDNAAMIAWTGMEMWEAGWRSDPGIVVAKKWSLDPAQEDGGILGVDGCNFVRREPALKASRKNRAAQFREEMPAAEQTRAAQFKQARSAAKRLGPARLGAEQLRAEQGELEELEPEQPEAERLVPEEPDAEQPMPEELMAQEPEGGQSAAEQPKARQPTPARFRAALFKMELPTPEEFRAALYGTEQPKTEQPEAEPLTAEQPMPEPPRAEEPKL